MNVISQITKTLKNPPSELKRILTHGCTVVYHLRKKGQPSEATGAERK